MYKNLDSKANFSKAEIHLKAKQRAADGNWGASSVIYGKAGKGMMSEVDKVRNRLERLHKFQERTPENFVAQIAFT
jgi:hypothetical protein